MKKILIVSQEAPPMVGGAGVVGWQNAKKLSELGNEVTFLTVSDDVLSCDAFKVITALRIPKLWLLFFTLKLRRLLKKEYDAIVINDIGSALAFSMAVNSRAVLRRTIVYLHGGEVVSVFKSPSALFKLFGFKKRYVKLLRECKSIVSVSHYMKKYFLDGTGIADLSEKISVVYAGVDESVFYPFRCDMHEQYNIDRNKRILLSVSRITKDKGYDLKFNVFKKLIINYHDFHWVVVGDGDYLDELKEKTAFNNLDRNITFLGALKREKLPVLYSSSDVFWLLSKKEAFGLAYMEAQMCGIPAIGLNNSGVVESISDNVSGFLVESEDECFNILSDELFENIYFDSIIGFSARFCLRGQVVKLMDLIEQ